MTRTSWRASFRRGAALCCAAAGAVLLVAALQQPAKAALGRILLERAFDARSAAPEEIRADAAAWRPWPWADMAPIGRLDFPTLGARRVVLDSASGEALAWGVGVVSGLAPLGAPGLTAVAGHRDGGFEILGGLQIGDVVELTTLDGAQARYRIVRREVVDSRRRRLPIRRHGPDDLVLATCWPIEALISGPERLLVHAVRIAPADG